MAYIFLFSLLLSSAQALALAPIPPGPTTPLPIQQGENYPCDQIPAKLAEYSDLARNQHGSITGFLTQVSDRVTEWFNQLSPLEGQTQTIEPGTFQPLQESAQQISTVTDAAYDNYQALEDEMDRIIVSLQACKITK